MPPPPIIDPELWDVGNVLYGPEEIRATNQQRFEMEQLDAVSYFDMEVGEIVGWKDVAADEFWVPGHVPGRPLMPGVIQMECLAQLMSFATTRVIEDIGFVGLAGITDAKFRATVEPGQRFVLLAKKIELKRRRAIYDAQGWVDGRLAIECRITGVRV